MSSISLFSGVSSYPVPFGGCTRHLTLIELSWAARKAASLSQSLIFSQSFCFFQSFKKINLFGFPQSFRSVNFFAISRQFLWNSGKISSKFRRKIANFHRKTRKKRKISSKNLDGFSLNFWDLSGAKVWKSCRSRKTWKNEYLVAIVAVDTAENEPLKVWDNLNL